MVQCASCHREVNSANGFCPVCGATIDPSQTPTEDLGFRRSSGTPAPSPANDGTRPAPGPIPVHQPASPPATPGPGHSGRFAAGTILAGRYRILHLLGRGGMGEVYRAEDLTLDQTVALKFLPPELSGDPLWLERVRREVTLARRVSHPNVCRVHDLGEVHDLLFISMEFIDGEDLASLLRRIGRPTGEKALEIARQVTAGLAAAHAAGVLHRDLKPANVMLDGQGRARLTDFGLAAPGDRSDGEELAGTPAYMAPEQLKGLGASPQSDLYALGLVFFELFTGSRAFSGKTLGELLRARAEITVPLPSEKIRDIDPRVEQVIMSCLSLPPEGRPASALAVLTALCGGDPVSAALAAGQTPSPEMVAASPAAGTLKPRTGLWLLAGIVILLAAYLYWGGSISLVERSALRLPPEALAEKSREVLAALGYPETQAGEAYGFSPDPAGIRLWETASRDHLGIYTRHLGQPSAIRFWFRSGPDYFRPAENRVSEDDPPLSGPGMVTLWTDPRGRLRRLIATPAESWVTLPVRECVTEETLWKLAGLEHLRLETGEPLRLPPVFADRQAGWRAGLPGWIGQEMRVEAAFLRNRLVFFELTGPLPADARPAPVRARPAAFLSLADSMNILLLCAQLTAVFLARRHLRQGLGDRVGAFRIAAAIFVLALVSRLLSASYAPVFAIGMDSLIKSVSRALYLAISAWLFYLALEPPVRRIWPNRLVSWTRLLSGRWRDPMVARDVLIALAVVASVAVGTMGLLILQAGSKDSPLLLSGLSLRPLLGFRFALSALANAMLTAVHTGLLWLVLLLLLRLVSRSQILITAALFLLISIAFIGVLATSTSGSWLVFIAMSVLGVLSWLVLLTRLGLLAVVVVMFVQLAAYFNPNAVDLMAWYSTSTWMPVVVIIGLAAYGYHFSTRRSPRGPRVGQA